jgi:hypothetical protein
VHGANACAPEIRMSDRVPVSRRRGFVAGFLEKENEGRSPRSRSITVAATTVGSSRRRVPDISNQQDWQRRIRALLATKCDLRC